MACKKTFTMNSAADKEDIFRTSGGSVGKISGCPAEHVNFL